MITCPSSIPEMIIFLVCHTTFRCLSSRLKPTTFVTHYIFVIVLNRFSHCFKTFLQPFCGHDDVQLKNSDDYKGIGNSPHVLPQGPAETPIFS